MKKIQCKQRNQSKRVKNARVTPRDIGKLLLSDAIRSDRCCRSGELNNNMSSFIHFFFSSSSFLVSVCLLFFSSLLYLSLFFADQFVGLVYSPTNSKLLLPSFASLACCNSFPIYLTLSQWLMIVSLLSLVLLTLSLSQRTLSSVLWELSRAIDRVIRRGKFFMCVKCGEREKFLKF